MKSLREQLALTPIPQREAILAQWTDEQCEEALRGAWWFTGRPEQFTPSGDWLIWLLMAGRGWGKTRTGAEWILEAIAAEPDVDGSPTEWAVVGETFSEVRDVCLDGPAGLRAAMTHQGMEEGRDFQINRGTMQLRFPSGAKVYLFSAKDPDVGRGYSLAGAWLDEFAKWRYADRIWSEGLAPSLRMGRRPRACVTTTPKSNVKTLRSWLSRIDGSVHVTRGVTWDNEANLSTAALVELRHRYEGTRVGRQELYGELIDDVEGALWVQAVIDEYRWQAPWWNPPLRRVVVGVDPSGGGDEIGIVAAGLVAPPCPCGLRKEQPHYVVLEDATLLGTPEVWGRAVVACGRRHNADLIAGEANYGGEMVRATITAGGMDDRLPYEAVSATRGKEVRAEPISRIYEQGRVHHVGIFTRLEDELVTWTPHGGGASPNRLDAMVWAMTKLAERVEGHNPARMSTYSGRIG